MGLSLDQYWDLTPKQWKKVLDAFSKRERDLVKQTDFSNFLLGKYVAYAFNDPKKYPKKPFLDKIGDEKDERNESAMMNNSEMERIIRANNIKLKGKEKHGN